MASALEAAAAANGEAVSKSFDRMAKSSDSMVLNKSLAASASPPFSATRLLTSNLKVYTARLKALPAWVQYFLLTYSETSPDKRAVASFALAAVCSVDNFCKANLDAPSPLVDSLMFKSRAYCKRREEEDLLVRKNSSQITNSFFVFQPGTNESIKNRMTQKISFVSPSLVGFWRTLFFSRRAKSSARESFGNEYVSIPSEGRNTYLVDELQTTNVFGSLIRELDGVHRQRRGRLQRDDRRGDEGDALFFFNFLRKQRQKEARKSVPEE